MKAALLGFACGVLGAFTMRLLHSDKDWSQTVIHFSNCSLIFPAPAGYGTTIVATNTMLLHWSTELDRTNTRNTARIKL